VRRALIIFIGAGSLLSLLLFVTGKSEVPAIDATELGRLVGRARVVWQDYGEDIKAGVGATPAAQWHGRPVEARLGESGIDVSFEVDGLWASYDFGIPILLRTPEEQVLTPTQYVRAEPGGVYTFRHPGPLDAVSTPWVELRYPPNEERRIVFDSTGVWRAPQGN